MYSDEERFQQVLVLLLLLCLLLSIFLILNIPSFHIKFMAQYGKVMMDFLTAPILLLQLSGVLL
jgi:hypothetical protein